MLLQFQLAPATIKPIETGVNNLSLVKKARELNQKESYGQVWCVSDADSKPDNPKQRQNFNTAILLTKKFGFGIAYSNQAFEDWLILHFEDHQGGAMHRNDYSGKIKNLLAPFKVCYDGTGNKIIEEDFFELLDGVDEKTGKKRAVCIGDHDTKSLTPFLRSVKSIRQLVAVFSPSRVPTKPLISRMP